MCRRPKLKRGKLTQVEIQEQLVVRFDTRFKNRSDKFKILLMGQLALLFMLAFVFMFRSGRELSLKPTLILIIVNAIWTIIIAIAHYVTLTRTMQQEASEKEYNLDLCNSMWLRVWEGGLGLLISTAILWGAVELWLFRGVVDSLVPVILVTSFFAVLAFVCIQHGWIVKVIVEGPSIHPKVWMLIAVFWGLIFVLPVFRGVGIIMQVSVGKEETINLMLWPFIVILWTLAVGIALLSMFAIFISQAQYHQWRELSLNNAVDETVDV
jgi:hypothetical protein